MSRQPFQCQSCGRPLPLANAVCQQCEGQLQRETNAVTQGKHRCPICDEWFNRPVDELFPRGAKWYVPKQFKPTCPRCKGFLRDRANPRLSIKQVGGLLAATVLTYLWLPAEYRKYGFAFLLVMYLAMLLLQRERNLAPAERFTKDETLGKPPFA